jgi:hypothetical protein
MFFMATFSMLMIDIRVIEFKKKKRRAAQGLLFLYGVNAFVVASTEYVTVNVAPLSVWNATAFPTKSMLPDAIGLA